MIGAGAQNATFPNRHDPKETLRPRKISPFRAAALAGLAVAAASGAPFPDVFDTEETPGGPMPAEQAVAGIQLPAGFRATVFAAEPDVRQPIAMATDSRGRLWVAENYTYSERGVDYHAELRDRIVIFEDADNDGRFDQRTVFWEGAERLTSIEIGFGGVWAIALPHLVFVPDRDGDDVPDSAPEVLLDGFDYLHSRHNVANGLRWGPDGWLYGRHGITSPSFVGRPGARAEQLTRVSAGIWRFHPLRRTFEVVADGTTNPWGMDWDQHGEPFFINTVIGHLWHLIPGAHYRRMHGDDPNPHAYELIDQHADHVHWATGEDWTSVRKGISNSTLAAGGGHAHVGLLIYQGGQWPAEWQGKLLTSNFHGRRFNVERLERVGSAIIGRREPDAFIFPDAWFRGLDLLAAPDGGVFVSDWSDAGECHDNDGVSRTTGRIFKLSYGAATPRAHGDLAQLPAVALARLQCDANDWLARQARRVFADRAAAGGDLRASLAELSRIEAESPERVHRLRAIWARHAAQASDPARLRTLLGDEDEHVRAWAIRLLVDLREVAATDFGPLARERLPAMAVRESSALVRLALASALQQIPLDSRRPLAAALLRRSEDASDHNLPLMLWYGIAPLAAAPDGHFDQLVLETRIPLVQRLGARRLAEEIDIRPERLDALLVAITRAGSIESRRAVLDGIAAALRGRRQAPAPRSWRSVQETWATGADAELHERVRDLSVVFGDGRALDEIRLAAFDTTSAPASRRQALRTLIEARPPDLREICERLLRTRGMSALAASGLAQFDDPGVAEYLLAAWKNIQVAERPGVMSALLTRPAWAAKVLDAVGRRRLARSDLGASHVRQIRAFKDPALMQSLAAVWGEVAESGASVQERTLAEWKRRLGPEVLARADLERGRTLFQAVCAGCHKLNGQGGSIGPDLTGSNRDNLDYLLENILFPSATLADAYRLTTLTMKDGRVLAGLVHGRSERTLKLQTVGETLSIDTSDIAKEERSALSLMPAGLLDAVGEEPARDLIAYLMTKDTADAAK